MTVWNSEPRTSRPKPIATLAPKYTAAMEKHTWTKVKPSITPTGHPDVGLVVLEDAVVDDLGVERREGQRGDGLHGLQDHHEDEQPAVRAEMGPQQPGQHGSDLATP